MSDHNKKTVMNKSLAEALMKAGMQHFDVGGNVPAGPTASSPEVGPMKSPTDTTTAGGVFGHTADPTGAFGNTTAGVVNNIGAIAQGAASAFTTQNGYQASLAPTDYSSYGQNINQSGQQALSGYGQAQNIQGQQQSLANTLLAQSQGQGPNPAQAALNQSTGTNVANQAALMASSRGAGANAGLVARQAAQQGAATQQSAVGQSATLQAQQSLAAQQALQQQQANMASGNTAEQAANAGIYSSSIAGQNTQNANNITNYANMQGINSQVAQNNANAVNKTEGGLVNSAGSVLAMLSKGGVVGKDGMKQSRSALPDHLAAAASIYHPNAYADGGSVASASVPNLSNASALADSKGAFDMPKPPGQGGGGDSSGGEEGDEVGGAAMMKGGGKVPGKAAVKGNSYQNDKVPALLSPGEDVLPRSVTQSPDAPKKAAEFVKHLMDKQGEKSGDSKGYAAVADSSKEIKALKDRIAKLEKRVGGKAK